ncbi:MAG: adenylate/guanylate cyclase domain-containing protein [Micavibrio sp.]|nr:adenylate/guanylate cyclase domain-containing protein [Micavibrio sp.]
MLRLLTKRWVQAVLLLVLLAAALDLQVSNPAPVRRLRDIAFDYYNRAIPRQPADDVVIVDLDEESLRRIGQWPWPRSVVADLPVILRQLGAKAVAYDVVFAEHDRTSPSVIARSLPQTPEMAAVVTALDALPDNDAVMAQKIAAAGNTITAFAGASQPTEGQPVLKAPCMRKKKEGDAADPLRFVTTSRFYAASLPVLTAAAAGDGSIAVEPEADGIVRTVPLLMGAKGVDGAAGAIYPALSLEALRLSLGEEGGCYAIDSDAGGINGVKIGQYYVPTDAAGKIRVYYAGHRSGLYIPAWQVLAQQVPADAVRGKIVLVGTSALGLQDLRSSALNAVVPGVEMHAEIIEQILHHQFLQRTTAMVQSEVVITAFVCLGIIFLAPFVGTGTLAFLAALMVGGGITGGFYIYQTSGNVWDPFYPSVVIAIIFILSAILTNLRTDMEKRMIRQAFSHYISPVLMEELAGNPEKLKLGGEVRELSVMFTDIRNFTTISESMDPADLIKMMNDFLTPMTSCVLDNRGTVDKYMGDAMMAFWNAPLEDENHARNACKAALDMVASLAPVNAGLKAEAEKAGRVFHELKAGIGINSGNTSVGNMGSKQRFAYSALGDTVNLASRMEGQTKGYGVSVMISSVTHRAAPEYGVIELDLLAVKGRSEPERVYALLATPEDARKAAFTDFATLHTEMLKAYRARLWDEALALGAQCQQLRPDLAGLYRLYAQRMAIYREKPPAADWQGLWVATDK